MPFRPWKQHCYGCCYSGVILSREPFPVNYGERGGLNGAFDFVHPHGRSRCITADPAVCATMLLLTLLQETATWHRYYRSGIAGGHKCAGRK